MSHLHRRPPHRALKVAIRTWLSLTRREQAQRQASNVLQKYLKLAEGLSDEDTKRPVTVPPMTGIDEDMLSWSFAMILEHNRIVNESITALTCQLARGEELHGRALLDPKHDVMPSASPGLEQVQFFEDSVLQHMAEVNQLGALRGTKTAAHPVFGDFDAHKWNSMFGFHLNLHLKQAAYVVNFLKS